MFPVKKTSIRIDSSLIEKERWIGEIQNLLIEHIYPIGRKGEWRTRRFAKSDDLIIWSLHFKKDTQDHRIKYIWWKLKYTVKYTAQCKYIRRFLWFTECIGEWVIIPDKPGIITMVNYLYMTYDIVWPQRMIKGRQKKENRNQKAVSETGVSGFWYTKI